MKKKFILLSLLGSGLVSAQVGVNTDTPRTTMDVNAKRNTSGVITDNAQTVGLQAPRLTRLELTSLTATYGTNQNGALIYVTDIAGGNATGQRINVTLPGYYYFDSVANVWQKFVAGAIPASPTEPWRVAGGTTESTANNQNIYQSGFIGISQTNPTYFQTRGIPRALSIIGDGNASDDVNIQSFTSEASGSAQVGQMKTRGTVGAVTPVQSGDGLGTLVFGGNVATGANPNYIESASIKGIVNGTVTTTSLPVDLQFNTGSVNDPNEKMRITSEGKVGIGVKFPNAAVTLDINATGGVAATTAPIRIRNIASTNTSANGMVLTIDNTGDVRKIPFNNMQAGLIPMSYTSLQNGTFSATGDESVIWLANSGITVNLPTPTADQIGKSITIVASHDKVTITGSTPTVSNATKLTSIPSKGRITIFAVKPPWFNVNEWVVIAKDFD